MYYIKIHSNNSENEDKKTIKILKIIESKIAIKKQTLTNYIIKHKK